MKAYIPVIFLAMTVSVRGCDTSNDCEYRKTIGKDAITG